MKVLDEAKAAIAKREADGREADIVLRRTAAMCSAYLGREITVREVIVFNLIQKLARLKGEVDITDSVVDLAGYAALLGKLEEF